MLYCVVDLETNVVDNRVDSVCNSNRTTDRMTQIIWELSVEVVGLLVETACGNRLWEGTDLGEAKDGEDHGPGEDSENKTASKAVESWVYILVMENISQPNDKIRHMAWLA